MDDTGVGLVEHCKTTGKRKQYCDTFAECLLSGDGEFTISFGRKVNFYFVFAKMKNRLVGWFKVSWWKKRGLVGKELFVVVEKSEKCPL